MARVEGRQKGRGAAWGREEWCQRGRNMRGERVGEGREGCREGKDGSAGKGEIVLGIEVRDK